MQPDLTRAIWRQTLEGAGLTAESREPLVRTALVQMKQLKLSGVIVHGRGMLVQLVEGRPEGVDAIQAAASQSAWRTPALLIERRTVALPALEPDTQAEHSLTEEEAEWLEGRLAQSGEAGVVEVIVDWAVAAAWSARRARDDRSLSGLVRRALHRLH